jgi:hypothetical protein
VSTPKIIKGEILFKTYRLLENSDDVEEGWIEVHTEEAATAIGAISGQDMSWESYNRCIDAIIKLDKMVDNLRKGSNI